MEETATDDQIRAAFVLQADEAHPDRNRGGHADALWNDLLVAYRTLSDTTDRGLYDEQLSLALAERAAIERDHDRAVAKLKPPVADQAKHEYRCAYVETNAIGLDLACPNPPSRRRESLSLNYCSTHAPVGAILLVPLSRSQRARLLVRYLLSLLHGVVLLAILALVSIAAGVAVVGAVAPISLRDRIRQSLLDFTTGAGQLLDMVESRFGPPESSMLVPALLSLTVLGVVALISRLWRRTGE